MLTDYKQNMSELSLTSHLTLNNSFQKQLAPDY